MELEFVRWLAEHAQTQPQVALGIGDDAAILSPIADHQLVVTTDMVTDGVHFDLQEHTAEQIGRKAFAVNLSDLAAMAATPFAAFVSLNFPRGSRAADLGQGLINGMLTLARQFACPIAGGDTNVGDGPLVVSVTAIGTVAPGKAWLRSGASPGDRLLVSGQLGGSLLGHHLDFEPRVAEALLLAAQTEVHAAMDLSDGLALDLRRMIEVSGVGAVVDVERLPIAPAANTMATTSGKTPLDHALSDGEDFELLLAVSPEMATKLLAEQPLKCGLTDIGEITVEESLLVRDASGKLVPLEATGYEH